MGPTEETQAAAEPKECTSIIILKEAVKQFEDILNCKKNDLTKLNELSLNTVKEISEIEKSISELKQSLEELTKGK